MPAIPLASSVQESSCRMRGDITNLCHRTKFNFIHFLPVVCRWGEQLPTSKVLVRSESDDTGPGHRNFLDLGVGVFQGWLARQCIKKSIACRSQNCSWVSSNTLPQKKRKVFLLPCLVHTLQDRGGCPSPHLKSLQNLLTGNIPTYSLPVHSHLLQEEDKFMMGWRGAHGLASAPLVTHAQTKSSNLPVPWFLPHPWNSKHTSVFHRAAVVVVNLMPLKHSDASTRARMQAETASQQNAGLCPRGGSSLLARHMDSLWSMTGPSEMSAKPLQVPKTEDGEMMTGFLRCWYTAAWSHCGEKDRKQNITIGRRPWTALESKSPDLNHSQQNNHKCRRKKRPNYEVLFAFFHCSQSKCLSLSIHKSEMPAQILKFNIANTSRHLKL